MIPLRTGEMAIGIGRRQFIGAFGGAAVAWPLAARAQQPMMPVIGFLGGASPDSLTPMVAAFHQGLKEIGYVEGQNVVIEYRWAEGAYDRLPALAADLVRRGVAVIYASAPSAVLAAKAATTTIPIVFTSGGDPVKLGLVSSLNHPGGNLSGVSFQVNELGAKRLELLRALVPAAAVIGFLVNPTRPSSESEVQDAQQGAQTLGVQLHVLSATSESDFAKAFATFAEGRIDALIVGSDSFFFSQRNQLVTLAEHYKIPAIYDFREYPGVGGLMSYAPSITEMYRQAGVYTANILKGAKPADLPVIQPTKFELVINLKTAKALGLTVPPNMLLLADEMIE
jgi:putative tryptophan/tyrosine transport system substrate-binding protein